MKKETIFLIDGSAYIYRAYHAVAPLTNSKGLQTNGVYGFTNMLRRLLKEKDPRYLCVAFDSRGPVFRHEMYKEYKANRPPMPDDLVPQIPYIKSIVKGFNISLLEEELYEADDIIATLATKMAAKGLDVVIVSGDKDLLQLVDDNILMLDPMKNKLFDTEAVQEKYGIPRDKLLDYFALVGDSSDNVPGITGVGPKTATKLINEYGSLEGLYEKVDSMKKSKMKEKIISGKDNAFLSRDLIRLKSDIELSLSLSDYEVLEENKEVLTELYNELEFHSLLQEVKVSAGVPVDGFKIITDAEEFSKLASKIEAAGYLVLDTETTSLDSRVAELVSISLCVDLEEAWYLPIAHKTDDGELCEGQLKLEDVVSFLRPYLEDETLPKLGHNLKYDFTVILKNMGVRMAGLRDTMIAAYLLDPTRRGYKLDDLCFEKELQLTSFSQVVGDDKREDCFAYVDIGKACEYSCEDVYGCLFLWQHYEEDLQKAGLMELFDDVEMKVVPILADMERRGVCLDRESLEQLSQEFNVTIAERAKEIHIFAGEEFNVNSPKQLGPILFEKLGLPHGKKTKTGYSTDVKVLEKLAPKYEIAAKILEYRSIAKLQSTYVEKLGALMDEKSGRVYTSFNQTVTATGRLSSSNPNLQNIPIRTEEGNRIRRSFVPQENMVFLSADYSQIDLRVLAHYSQDEGLLTAFREGQDIHEMTARLIFSGPLFVTSEMRRVAKSINFGIVYGMSSYGLSNQLGLSRKDAQTFIDRYFENYSGVKTFMTEIIEKAREDGYVTTLCNRRRMIPEINAKNKNLREFAERTALNTPIQGTAADIIKLAMIRVDEQIRKHDLQAKLLLQIHDELVFELPESELDITKTMVKKSMENALALDVPLVVNYEVGNSLAKGE